MPSKKLKKKFVNTRSSLASKLQGLLDQINEVDTYTMSPDDVAGSLADLTSDLEQFRDDLEEV